MSLLLDKGELTSGSTWHAAGMVTHFHTSPTIMRMRAVLDPALPEPPGGARARPSTGTRSGASASPRAADQWLFLRRQVGTARALGLDVDTISPAEALRLFPLMSPDDLHGAMYLPGDGWIDPSGSTTELARARAGARRGRRDRRARDRHRAVAGRRRRGRRDGSGPRARRDRDQRRGDVGPPGGGDGGGQPAHHAARPPAPRDQADPGPRAAARRRRASATRRTSSTSARRSAAS